MGLLRPNQLSPQNTVIDATDDNRFSWVTNGAKQTDYRVYIYNNDTNALLHDSTKVTSPNKYYDLDANTLTNGTNCKWYVNTWAGTDNRRSEYEFVVTNATPVVEFSTPDFSTTIEDNVNTYDETTGYTNVFCTLSKNSVTYLSQYASSSLTLTAGTTGLVYVYHEANLDLTKFSNGVSSDTGDLIYVACNVSLLSDVATNGIRIQFGDGSDNYYYE